jgi:hypothetical protein
MYPTCCVVEYDLLLEWDGKVLVDIDKAHRSLVVSMTTKMVVLQVRILTRL